VTDFLRAARFLGGAFATTAISSVPAAVSPLVAAAAAVDDAFSALRAAAASLRDAALAAALLQQQSEC
jgi:hypothetical protein